MILFDMKGRNTMEKFYNENGDLAVLISPDYGVGWSTVNDERIAYDKRIIEYWLNESPSSNEMEEFLISLGYDHTHMDGYDSLIIEYIPKGTMFYIDECDGSESIVTEGIMLA